MKHLLETTIRPNSCSLLYKETGQALVLQPFFSCFPPALHSIRSEINSDTPFFFFVRSSHRFPILFSLYLIFFFLSRRVRMPPYLYYSLSCHVLFFSLSLSLPRRLFIYLYICIFSRASLLSRERILCCILNLLVIFFNFTASLDARKRFDVHSRFAFYASACLLTHFFFLFLPAI